MKKKINLINIKINQSSKKKLSKLNLRNKIAIGDWCELIENIYLNKKDYKFLDFNNWHNLKKIIIYSDAIVFSLNLGLMLVLSLG